MTTELHDPGREPYGLKRLIIAGLVVVTGGNRSVGPAANDNRGPFDAFVADRARREKTVLRRRLVPRAGRRLLPERIRLARRRLYVVATAVLILVAGLIVRGAARLEALH